jgi:4-hydroxy-tetrahydrodipicolinate reductase
VELDAAEAMVDFTIPAAVERNVREAAEGGLPSVVGTSGFDQEAVHAIAREHDVACFHAPNFALGAVLMMRFAAEAARLMPRAAIVELHHETKLDAPSGTAKATAALVGGDPEIYSIRLPGLVAHQEVLFGDEGQLLTIRHDTYSREAFVPGVLLALERLPELPPGLTVGLDALL